MFWIPAFAGMTVRCERPPSGTLERPCALTRTRFAGVGGICRDAQDGHDRIDEMLYANPQHSWIEGAKTQDQMGCSTSSRSPLIRRLTIPFIPFIHANCPSLTKLGTRERGPHCNCSGSGCCHCEALAPWQSRPRAVTASRTPLPTLTRLPRCARSDAPPQP